ncbi:MAG TPA: TonB family protein, partial [Candidatus Sulfotelmatobacter sp.]|nr:TonB family protein [Candidatus Sulfotelmatobacter sp.]
KPMRNTRIIVLCIASFFGPMAFAQIGLPEYVPLKINQTVDASYPPSMVTAGVKSGAASVAISVDDSGQLTDYVVTAYTNSAFAEEALAALRKWTFEPARIYGAPRNSKADLTFRFELNGVAVVSMDVILYNELVHFKIAPNSDVYSACTLSQLDRIPSPTKVVNPVYPKELARSSHGGHVQVEFYIDPQGRVRMPSVTKETIEANAELAAVAVMAVAQWQFAPPMSKGRPVLVLAYQDFNFKPASS